MTIIADSGSTKTEWITQDRLSVITKGINPVRDTVEEILHVIDSELMPGLFSLYCKDEKHDKETFISSVREIQYYGAGCIEPFSESIHKSLSQHFINATIQVHSDLLGAARALCGHNEGIACILGTGSNSCMCSDGRIERNISPLGYILGDEGSGAVLGRTLVAEMLKGSLQDMWPEFSARYSLSVTDIINKVYRQPQANRFLASLVPFIKENIHIIAVRQMVVNEFVRFLQRNVVPYGRPDLPVNFVGGIAKNFQEEIYSALHFCTLKPGIFMARPAEAILNYHKHVI